MVSLKSVTTKFDTSFQVIEGGSGIVRGTLDETNQAGQPSYVFVQPRHVFRAAYPTPLKPGMVIRSRIGSVFIVGENGPSENWRGTLWQSFRLFEPTGQYLWSRRTQTTDPITNLPKDIGHPEPLGLIWAALESLDREQYDRGLHVSFEQARIITGVNLKDDDLVDNRPITKVDKLLGLSIGVLT